MLIVILGGIFILAGIGLYLKKVDEAAKPSLWKTPAAIVLGVIGVFCLLMTSFVYVARQEVGLLNRVYGASDLPVGKIIATKGEKGPQADVLGPGFHFSPLIRVLNDISFDDVVQVPEGYYGQLVAKDGKAMPAGMYIAPGFADDAVEQMLDAKHFLENGGFRGPQETVLKPGTYRINHYLFDVTVDKGTQATVIPAGFVGVVKSNIGSRLDCREKEAAAAPKPGALSVTLVPKGCVGIWDETLLPGAYYLNRNAYEVTVVDTRVATWDYRGGYTKRSIALQVSQQGQITQVESQEERKMPEGAADTAVFVKIEGWDIPLELRVLVQVDNKTAPIVVGAVGGVKEIEDRILTPTIRSIVRNIAGKEITVPVRLRNGDLVSPPRTETRQVRVLDLIENRDAIEAILEREIKAEGEKAGLQVREIRVGEPAIPPELLVSRLREQLAGQLKVTYERETEAQTERTRTEQARATADQQQELVKSQIGVQVAEQTEKRREAEGRAERKYLEELAQGQQKQAEVLGKDKVVMLQALDTVLDTLRDKPEIAGLINRLVPNILVTSENGGGLAGAAAVFGNAVQSGLASQAAGGSPAK
jgi:hypothetical protein